MSQQILVLLLLLGYFTTVFVAQLRTFCENLETKKLYKLIEYLYSLKKKRFILNFPPISLLPKYLGFVSIVP